jgi:sec-independent protein translocase protein TatB
MFGLSFTEIVIIAVLALILLGPDKLPEVAKQGGKLLRQFKAATEDLKEQIESEVYADERKVARPALVPPVPAAPVPGPSGPPPVASVENVPGLEAALAEVPGETPPAPAASAPASSPQT